MCQTPMYVRNISAACAIETVSAQMMYRVFLFCKENVSQKVDEVPSMHFNMN